MEREKSQYTYPLENEGEGRHLNLTDLGGIKIITAKVRSLKYLACAFMLRVRMCS